MSENRDNDDSIPPSTVEGGNGNGKVPREEIDEAEYFLVPLLATDPLPYLFDAEGNPVNADGDPLAKNNGVPKQIRELQKELKPNK